MKKKILFLTAVLVCLSIAMTGTLAYFTADNVAHNVITTGKVNIALQEWADEGHTVPFENLEGVMPGNEITKIAIVKNTGTAPAWIRVKIDIAVTKQINDKNDKNDKEVRKLSSDKVTVNIDTENWKRGADGYYYYQKALDADAKTKPIFTSVLFDKGMGNEYQDSTASVDVLVQAVQTANNGDSAENASGWPQNGSTVTP